MKSANSITFPVTGDSKAESFDQFEGETQRQDSAGGGGRRRHTWHWGDFAERLDERGPHVGMGQEHTLANFDGTCKRQRCAVNKPARDAGHPHHMGPFRCPS